MRIVIVALLLAASAWAQTEQPPAKAIPQQGRPPKGLMTRPDGHVSANQDPKQADKFDLHVVIKGETLSGISDGELKNSHVWPQLWEQNEHIINPHWIYPNDKILIKPVTPITEAQPPEPEPEPESEIAQGPPPRPVLQPPPSAPQSPAQPVFIVEQERPVSEAKFDDIYCSGSIRKMKLPNDLMVISKMDPSIGILSSDGEYVYLSQGSQGGVGVGNLYQVVRQTNKSLNNQR